MYTQYTLGDHLFVDKRTVQPCTPRQLCQWDVVNDRYTKSRTTCYERLCQWDRLYIGAAGYGADGCSVEILRITNLCQWELLCQWATGCSARTVGKEHFKRIQTCSLATVVCIVSNSSLSTDVCATIFVRHITSGV
jgi:hypothetical protein